MLPALAHAARMGDADGVRAQLLATRSPDGRSPCGWTPLADAAWGGHLDASALLLQAGANPNICSRDGLSPLMIAAYRGHADLCHLLLAHGANPTIATSLGRTALEGALRAGSLTLVGALTRAGAWLDRMHAVLYVRTVLGRAGRRTTTEGAPGPYQSWAVDGNFHIDDAALSLIGPHLQGRQRPNRVVLDGDVCFRARPDLAPFEESEEWIAMRWRHRKGWTELAQAAIHGERGPDEPDEHGFLPLLDAIQDQCWPAVRALLDAGANPNLMPGYGCMRGATVLVNAAHRGCAIAVADLVRAGAEVEARTAGEWTALMAAAAHGHADSVSLLLQAGADPAVRNAQGQDAMALAVRNRHPGTARLLLVALNSRR